MVAKIIAKNVLFIHNPTDYVTVLTFTVICVNYRGHLGIFGRV